MAQTQNRTNFSSNLGAGIVGAAMGAAFVYFSDKKNQKNAQVKLQSLQKDLNKTVNSWLKKVDEFRGDASDKAEDVKEAASEKAHAALEKEKEMLDKIDKKDLR